MYCEHCGETISDNAKFCPNCGQPVAQTPEGTETRTRVLKRQASTTAEVPKTTAMPRPAARHARVETSASPIESPAQAPTPASEPPREKRSALPFVLAAAAIVLVLVTLLAMNMCSKGSSQTVKTTEQETEVSDSAATNEAESEPSKEETATADEEEAVVTPTGSRAGGPADDISQATIESWSKKACSFMTFFPVNHVLAGGAGDDPSPMSIEDWADNCLRYVDESSSLGQALSNDPESVAAPLGFNEVASYVSDTSVISVDATGVTVEVTIEGTQMDWQHTSTVVESFLVQFDDNEKIVNIVAISG